MGDVAMSLHALLALRRQFPGVRLTLVAKPQYAAIFRKIPNAEVLSADTNNTYRGLPGLFRLYRHLKRSRPHAVADLHNVLRTRILGLLFRINGVRVIRIDKGRPEKRRLTQPENKSWQALKPTHERYADVFRELGYPLVLTPADVLPREPWPENLMELLGSGSLRRIGIAPFAAHAGKVYPVSAMEQVVRELDAQPGVRIYLFGGGKAEAEVLGQWEAAYTSCVSLAGKVPLAGELGIISNLDLMVSMDSGNGHLAALYGVPVVSLWGVTHPFLGFAPYGQPQSHSLLSDREAFPKIPTSVYGNKVPPGYERAMESIPPGLVVEKVLEVAALRQ